jgi:hypothetical protein
MRPVRIFLKEDGAIDDKPSFAILMTHDTTMIRHQILGQVSLKMWNEGLADVGYEIIKISDKKKLLEAAEKKGYTSRQNYDPSAIK